MSESINAVSATARQTETNSKVTINELSLKGRTTVQKAACEIELIADTVIPPLHWLRSYNNTRVRLEKSSTLSVVSPIKLISLH